MVEFRRVRGGGARLLLDDAETDVLRNILTELRTILVGSDSASDPVVERLLPDAYEDARDEAAYRELIGDDLVRTKVEALDAIDASLGDAGSDITIDGDALHQWLASLTDMRLAIGIRLDVTEDRMSRELEPGDPDFSHMAVLHWLGWIQEGLLQASGGA